MRNSLGNEPIAPVFIFSLPRSGSTLLARMLGAHPEIASSSEPWLLLPSFYALRKSGVYAEYMHKGVYVGVRDFIELLPDGLNGYHEAVRNYALTLYRKAAGENVRYFVDKTPRYSLIASDILQAFPDAKFIFLWRNPLAIAGSLIDGFGKGRWNLYDYYIDLYYGIDGLLNAYAKAKESAYAIRYEDLVSDPASTMRQVCAYLEVNYSEKMIQDFPAKVVGLGDKIGSRKYGKKISSESKEKWKRSFNNPVRRLWAVRYCHWLGNKRLQPMGYRKEELLEGLREERSFNIARVFSDLVRMLWGMARRNIPFTPVRDVFCLGKKNYPNCKVN